MCYKKNNTLSSLILVGSLGIGVAEAQTFNVSKTADTSDGVCNADCSLREAVIAANALAGADVINIPAGAYKLTISGTGENASATGDLDITDDLTINGAGSGQTIIDGNFIGRVIEIAKGKNVELNDLAIINGLIKGFDSGGGLYNQGNTTLNNLHFEGNVSEVGGGGAIENWNDDNTNNLTVNSSKFTGNCAGFGGGAIDGEGGLTITASIFDSNVPVTNIEKGINCLNDFGGGAIHMTSVIDATIDGSTFINNIGGSGAISGGGIGGSQITITNSTFAYNTGLGRMPLS